MLYSTTRIAAARAARPLTRGVSTTYPPQKTQNAQSYTFMWIGVGLVAATGYWAYARDHNAKPKNIPHKPPAEGLKFDN
ncbi:hypothetical protein MNV49_006817 [Pseudohyphozyma bogoriensis]|nr:hypothetical protein MNV49_006817 [Pseudohyphozyma bogoriensis]